MRRPPADPAALSLTAALEALRVATAALEHATPEVTPGPALPRWLRAREVATILGLSIQQVYYLMGKGVLPTVRINRAVRVPEDELRRYMERQKQLQQSAVPMPILTATSRRLAL